MGANKKVQVPDNPIIPYIEGDGTGRDIWRASARVFDAAVEKAYKGKKKIHWMEVYAGEKSFKQYNSWLHEETVPAFTEFLVGIKGPLTTPIGGGMTSLNVGLRKLLDLYVCLRPIRYFNGVPSPVKHPEFVDMQGTNVEQGRQILAESGLTIISAETMAEAAEKIVKAVQTN